MKAPEAHEHKLRRAYKRDGPQSEQDAERCSNYNKGARWIKLWACVLHGCNYKLAYDLTHINPKLEHGNAAAR